MREQRKQCLGVDESNKEGHRQIKHRQGLLGSRNGVIDSRINDGGDTATVSLFSRRPRRGSSATACTSQSRDGYDPTLIQKTFFLLHELLVTSTIFVVSIWPFLKDIAHTHLKVHEEERLPASINDLLKPDLFARLAGRSVSQVSFADRLEQHANSTERTWLKVTYTDEANFQQQGVASTSTPIFAKIQARKWIVRVLMSSYDVYRNELHTYAALRLPVLTPHIHIAQWTPSRFVLAMDDLRYQDVEFPNIWDTQISKSLAKRVLSTLSKIHAKYWNHVPSGVWNDQRRPYLPAFMGMYTLHNAQQASSHNLVDVDMQRVFLTALWHWPKLRQFWSRPGNKTLCHGDPHIGNFYITHTGVVGTFDFQTKCEEHPMRDVTYFLGSSYPEDALAQDEEELLRYYLSELHRNGVPLDQIPSYDECILQYRMHSFYTLYAFIFFGGFANLMDSLQTRIGVRRIVAQMKRINAAGALYDMLDGKFDNCSCEPCSFEPNSTSIFY
mmetsp:Transcript_17050/g.33347  ORF Transcript_17050/g.33347 Transcript_17050/m.33347 type:complete len:499 (+) Transcript_17050:541-2037(+)